VEDLARLSFKRNPLYVGIDDTQAEATREGLEQGYCIVPSAQRFLLLFTFLKKNASKKAPPASPFPHFSRAASGPAAGHIPIDKRHKRAMKANSRSAAPPPCLLRTLHRSCRAASTECSVRQREGGVRRRPALQERAAPRSSDGGGRALAQVMVFFSSCAAVKYHAELLNYIDIPVKDIHGKQKQQRRTTTFHDFCKADTVCALTLY